MCTFFIKLGRLIIGTGKLLSKDPRDQTGSKIINPTLGEWRKIGILESVKQLQIEDRDNLANTDVSTSNSDRKRSDFER